MKYLLVLLIALSGAAIADDLIDGFGGYKFGMTLKEAKEIRTDAKQTKCEYTKLNIDTCLEYDDNFYGEQATVTVLFEKSSNKVHSVAISFDRFGAKKGSDDCIRVATTLFPRLVEKYGDKFKFKNTIANFPEGTWYPSAGGKLSMKRFCIDNDSGMVSIVYEPAGSL